MHNDPSDWIVVDTGGGLEDTEDEDGELFWDCMVGKSLSV